MHEKFHNYSTLYHKITKRCGYEITILLLFVLGPVCSDPGRPADGEQISTSYELGKTVTFTCERRGFEPDPPKVVCVSSGVSVEWNDTRLKQCIGKTLLTLLCTYILT